MNVDLIIDGTESFARKTGSISSVGADEATLILDAMPSLKVAMFIANSSDRGFEIDAPTQSGTTASIRIQLVVLNIVLGALVECAAVALIRIESAGVIDLIWFGSYLGGQACGHWTLHMPAKKPCSFAVLAMRYRRVCEPKNAAPLGRGFLVGDIIWRSDMDC